MATPHPSFPVLLLPLLLLFPLHRPSQAAVLPAGKSSAHEEEAQKPVTSPELDLAHLSLPPEVIMEALFSQTDLLQDQLEQCEEMVRNNLKADDAAETEGIDDNEEEDDGDDNALDGDEDEPERKGAQMAADAASHADKKVVDDDDDDDNSNNNNNNNNNKDNNPPQPGGGASQVHSSADSAASKKPGNVRSSVHGGGNAGDANDEKEKNGDDEEGEEYIVYEYEDAGDDKPSADDRGESAEGEKDARNSEEKPEKDEADKKPKEDEEEDARSSQKDSKLEKENDKNEHVDQQGRHSQGNQGVNPSITAPPGLADSVTDTADSDSEEPQPRPEEADLSKTVTPSENDGNTNASSENSHSLANQNHPENATRNHVESGKNNTVATTGFQNKGEGSEERNERTTPSAVEAGTTQPKVLDNNSERSRPKRSLSLDQVVLGGIVEGDLHNDVHKVTFGKGRIRRQAFPPESLPSWLLKDADLVLEEKRSFGQVLNKVLGPSPVQTREEDGPGTSENSSPAAPDFRSSGSRLPITNPTRKGRDEGRRQVIQMTEKSSNLDLGHQEGALAHEANEVLDAPKPLEVIQMAEKFLQARKPSQSSGGGLRTSDQIEVQRLLATSRAHSRAERVRRRRSALKNGLAPDRYVPLIEQLTERLSYLRHSVRVCHMLLPSRPVPDEYDVA